MHASHRFVTLLLLVAVSSAGCGLKMEQHYQQMRPFMVEGNWNAAADFVEGVKEKFYGDEKNRVLYYMDMGYTLHMAKQYDRSQTFLTKAADSIQDLWTESISSHLSALVGTDNSLPYQGEDFEKVMVHVYGALNFALQNNYESARIEARIVTDKLELYNSKYEESKNVYRDDAFIRWFSGWLRETEGGVQALNDAKIDYHNAVDLYRQQYTPHYATPLPSFVVQDLFRTAEASGIMDTVEDIREAYPDLTWPKQSEIAGQGQVLFIHQNGESPHKIDRYIEAQAGDDKIRVAFPELVTKPKRITTARMTIEGTALSTQTKLMQPITKIAVQNLSDRMGRIMTKAIATAVAKYLAAKGAQKAGQSVGGTAGTVMQLGGAIFGAVSYAVEEADKRSWITLPSEIWAGRLFLDPGVYTIKVDFMDANGRTVKTRSYPGIEVTAGGRAMINDRTFM